MEENTTILEGMTSISALLNTALDLMFVLLFHMRVEGVAYATTTRDPAFTIDFTRVSAKDFREVVVKMRTKNAQGTLQLFWASYPSLVCEAASIQQRIVTDGEWHEYRFPVAGHAAWRGRVGMFRLDPGNIADAEVEFASVRLEK